MLMVSLSKHMHVWLISLKFKYILWFYFIHFLSLVLNIIYIIIINMYFTLGSLITFFWTLKPVLGGQVHLLWEEFTLESGQEEVITVIVSLRYCVYINCIIFVEVEKCSTSALSWSVIPGPFFSNLISSTLVPPGSKHEWVINHWRTPGILYF